MKTLGIILLVVGVILMAIKALNITTKEEVADLGPIEINKKETTTTTWPLYVGAVSTIAGIVILVADRKK